MSILINSKMSRRTGWLRHEEGRVGEAEVREVAGLQIMSGH